MSDEFPHQCKYCNSKFAEKEFLDKHTENHFKSNILDYSREILDSLNELIKLTWPITRERLKQMNIMEVTTENQAFKIVEEVVEFTKEVYKSRTDKADWKHLDHENIDILFAWLALQHVMSQNKGIEKFPMIEVLNKFQERGWLKF